MAARTLDRMRKAQSLIRECHSWLLENDEILLAVELCNIEGRLALLFENRYFLNTPCPGLRDEQLPRLPPSSGLRHRTPREPYNGGRRPHQINRSRTKAPASRASGGQNPQARTTITTSRSRAIVSKSTCPDAVLKAPRVRAAATGASPPTGVLLDFDDDVELVQLPPNMVPEMEAANSGHIGSKETQHLPEEPAAVGSDEPAPGGLVRVDGDDRSLHQTIATAADVALSGPDSAVGNYCSPPVVEEGVVTVPVPVPVPSQPQPPGSPACDSLEGGSPCTQAQEQANGMTESQKGDSIEEFPVLTSTGGFTEDVLVDLDDDLAVILPGGADTDTNRNTHLEENDVLSGDLDRRAGQNPQPEDLEDDDVVFQGNAAKSIRPDFKALFVSSDDDSQTSRRPIDLRAIFEKYSEVIICK